jgi:hypothetical protein
MALGKDYVLSQIPVANRALLMLWTFGLPENGKEGAALIRLGALLACYLVHDCLDRQELHLSIFCERKATNMHECRLFMPVR